MQLGTDHRGPQRRHRGDGGRRRGPGRRKTGFTLIEILIVISIIAILAAMITSGVLYVRKQAEDAMARSQVEQFATALDRFNAEEGYYPGAGSKYDDPEVNAFPELFEALLGERKPKGKGGRSAPYLDKIKEADIVVWDENEEMYRQATPDERWDPEVPKYIRDPWGQPLWYRENKSRPRQSYMHNPRKFDIWSIARNHINDTLEGNEKSDDIGNW